MTLKLLHAADFHLGMTFQNRNYPDDVRQRLVEARYEALEKVVALAVEEKCDLLVIAGDLFHRLNIKAEQVSKVVNILKKFTGITAYLPGNHDFYESNNQLWSTINELAFDDLVLLTETKPYQLRESGIDLVLYPAPCRSKHSAIHQLAWIGKLAERPSGQWHIGIAHGTVRGVSPDLKDEYFPMEEKELTSLGLDHWCLGHTHIPYPDLKETAKQPFVYSGTPEPDGFDCRHGGGVWITELNNQGEIYSRQVATGQFKFIELHQEVKKLGDLRLLQEQLSSLSDNSLVKLKLTGEMPEDDYKERTGHYKDFYEKLIYLEIDDRELAMEISPELISSKFSQDSFPQRLLLRLFESGDYEALQTAFRLIEEVKK